MRKVLQRLDQAAGELPESGVRQENGRGGKDAQQIQIHRKAGRQTAPEAKTNGGQRMLSTSLKTSVATRKASRHAGMPQ